MARMIEARIEIAKWIAAAASIGPEERRVVSPMTHGRMAWEVADSIVSRAEEMQAEDDRLAAEEAERIREEHEDAVGCMRPWPSGFTGPCVVGPHADSVACINAAGDQW